MSSLKLFMFHKVVEQIQSYKLVEHVRVQKWSPGSENRGKKRTSQNDASRRQYYFSNIQIFQPLDPSNLLPILPSLKNRLWHRRRVIGVLVLPVAASELISPTRPILEKRIRYVLSKENREQNCFSAQAICHPFPAPNRTRKVEEWRVISHTCPVLWLNNPPVSFRPFLMASRGPLETRWIIWKVYFSMFEIL